MGSRPEALRTTCITKNELHNQCTCNGKSMSVSASTCTTCVAAKEHKRGDNVAVHNLRWPRPPATTAFDRNRCFRVLNPLQLHKKLSLRVIGTVHRVVGTGTCPGTTKQTKCALPEIRLGRPISGPEAPLINIGLCPCVLDRRSQAACPATPPFQN